MYLVKVLSKNSQSKTFDHLSYSVYRLGKANTISDLPLTSASIKFHILRAFYATFVQINYLNINANKLDPIRYGYYSNENYILPQKPEDNIYPSTSELTPSCQKIT